jgi:hypothetical protein
VAGKSRSTRTKPVRKQRPALPAVGRKTASDQLEGDEGPEGIENYPLDDLLIRTESRAIQDVLRRIANKQIELDPEFQRAFLWKEDKQSKLIESVLMRIPLQVFYFAENEDGDLVVVDGLQRLTTFQRFFKNELKLDLKAREQLHGKTFAGIDTKLQIRFEDGQLTFYIIGAKVPERVRLDIFERVNSGTPLTRQQMRHAIYSGQATRLLTTLAGIDLFKDVGGALGSDANVRAMKDREAINRFLAYFQFGWREYLDSNYDDFLARALRETNDRVRDKKVVDDRSAVRTKAAAAFEASMRMNTLIFGEHAFRKSLVDPQSRRSAFNLALFDVFSATLAHYDERAVSTTKAKAIQAATVRLLKNKKFHDAVSFATLEASNVQARFEMVERMLAEVLGAPNT